MQTLSQPLISIIIPTYNRALLIENTLQSVQNQTYLNWECIVVDDFSTDNTNEIVQQFTLKDSRFKFITNQRKKGAQFARNTGILNAEGDWIAFNDSDDEWMPNKLERQFEILKEKSFNSFLVIHSNCKVKTENLNSTTVWELPLIDGEKPFKRLLKISSPMFQGLLTSSIALKKINYLDENVPSYQEWDTAIRLSKICDFIHIEEPLFIYHKHNQETISKDIKRDIEGANYVRLKYRKDFIEQYGQSSFQYFLLKNIHRSIINNLWEFGIELLNEAKGFISKKTYYYWICCFSLRLDPMEGKRRVIKNFLKKL